MIENLAKMPENKLIVVATENENFKAFNGRYSSLKSLDEAVSANQPRLDPISAMGQLCRDNQAGSRHVEPQVGGLYIIGTRRRGYSLAERSGSGTGYVSVANISLG